MVLPPLILYAQKGVYTAEAEEIFSGRAVSPVWARRRKAVDRRDPGVRNERKNGIAKT
jgi:hypothetical protein